MVIGLSLGQANRSWAVRSDSAMLIWRATIPSVEFANSISVHFWVLSFGSNHARELLPGEQVTELLAFVPFFVSWEA